MFWFCSGCPMDPLWFPHSSPWLSFGMPLYAIGCTYGFLGFSYDFPSVFLWFSLRFPSSLPLVFSLFAFSFPAVGMWFRYGIPLVLWWYPYGFLWYLMHLLLFPTGLPLASLCFVMWLPYACLLFSLDSSWNPSISTMVSLLLPYNFSKLFSYVLHWFPWLIQNTRETIGRPKWNQRGIKANP